MTDNLAILSRSAGPAPVHCRSFRKADGRMLYLYGHDPHDLPALPQSPDDIATGGELRFHPLRQEWNVFAAHRQNRTFKPSAADDPLAPSRPGSPETEIPFTNFELAVFENKFTALHPGAPAPTAPVGVEARPATGRCEVVIYAPEARGNLATIGQARRNVLISAWLDRYQKLFADGCQYVLPFENRGDAVGVTLHHPHGQIYGFGQIPAVQQRAVDAFAKGFDLSAEITASLPDYAVADAGDMAAWCPRFARFPYETWIAPRQRREGLWDSSDAELEGLSDLLGQMTARYDALFGQPTPTMLALHCAPNGGAHGFHWTAQFYPLLRGQDRIKYLASVEQHTGMFTVDVMPEAAAEALRGAVPDGW